MEEEIRYEEALERMWVTAVRLLVVEMVWQGESVRGRVLIGVVSATVEVVGGVEVVVNRLTRVAAW